MDGVIPHAWGLTFLNLTATDNGEIALDLFCLLILTLYYICILLLYVPAEGWRKNPVPKNKLQGKNDNS